MARLVPAGVQAVAAKPVLHFHLSHWTWSWSLETHPRLDWTPTLWDPDVYNPPLAGTAGSLESEGPDDAESGVDDEGAEEPDCRGKEAGRDAACGNVLQPAQVEVEEAQLHPG